MDYRASNFAKTDGEPFIIAGWRVDPVSLRITNDKRTIKLEPKAMAVLDYLACRPGTVVSRQELEDVVWAGTIVGYDALSNAIIKLRKALGDKARKPRFIETIAKSGYRLIAEVSIEDQAAPGIAKATAPVTPVTPTTSPVRSRLSVVSATAVVFVLAIGIGIWWQPWAPRVEPASLEKMAFPLPDKPSIAVLPFTNISNDAEQEYFADGMTEDLITDISKVSGLFVIARNSVFNYKGKTIEISQVAEELGVRYVMEGSVRRVGNQVRINVQLIDATTSGNVWAERYDGSLNDVFSMQDKITQRIVTALSVTLTGQERDNLVQAETRNPEAYDAFLRGWEYYRLNTPNDFKQAVIYFKQAIELDPDYARAHSALAAVYWNIASNGWWTKSLGLTATQAVELSRLTLKKALEQPSALAHQVASERAAYFRGKPDRALAEAESAIAQDANDPAGHMAMANALLKAGKPNEAIISMRHAMRLDPHFPASYLTRLARAQFALGQYQEAATTLEQSTGRNPQDDRAYVFLAAAYGQLDRTEDAKSAIDNANILRARTGWDELTLQDISSWKWAGDLKEIRGGLIKAGVEYNYGWYALITRTGDDFGVEGATTINVETAKQLHDRGVPFIDIYRSYFQGHIPGAYNLLWYRSTYSIGVPREFNERRLLNIADKNTEIVIYGGQSIGAAYATAYAIYSGFQNVYYFENGLDQWKAAGYPVEKGK